MLGTLINNTTPALGTTQMPILKRTDSAIEIKEDSPRPDSPTSQAISSTLPIKQTSTQMLLDEAILTRHSTRQFLPTPVPRALLEHALELATHSPSNTNTQAWRSFIVTGSALARLKSSLVSIASSSSSSQAPPQILPSLPPSFAAYRSALGRLIYHEGWGLAPGDVEGRRAAAMRNYEFFGAPVAVVVCMDADLAGQMAFSVGMYVQTLLLALAQAGLGSCVQIGVAGYPDVVRREVGIAEGLRVLVGVAVGFEDCCAKVNLVRSSRDGVGRNTVWVE